MRLLHSSGDLPVCQPDQDVASVCASTLQDRGWVMVRSALPGDPVRMEPGIHVSVTEDQTRTYHRVVRH